MLSRELIRWSEIWENFSTKGKTNNGLNGRIWRSKFWVLGPPRATPLVGRRIERARWVWSVKTVRDSLAGMISRSNFTAWSADKTGRGRRFLSCEALFFGHVPKYRPLKWSRATSPNTMRSPQQEEKISKSKPRHNDPAKIAFSILLVFRWEERKVLIVEMERLLFRWTSRIEILLFVRNILCILKTKKDFKNPPF